jgi:6-pyruvoyltetrahydropterin/6-carboxytetrahydropterin synthase
VNITKEFNIHYAHRLLHHKNECKNLHGHTGVFRITLGSETVNEENGMIMDFKRVKSIVEVLTNKIDHSVVINPDDPLRKAFDTHLVPYSVLWTKKGPVEPTAENLATAMLFSTALLFDEERTDKDLPFVVLSARFAETSSAWAETTTTNGGACYLIHYNSFGAKWSAGLTHPVIRLVLNGIFASEDKIRNR